MQREKVFANACAFDGENNLHIYDDGYVLAVACSDESRIKIRQDIADAGFQTEEAMSDDGFLTVWVIPCLRRHSDLNILRLHSSKYHDHRTEDYHTLTLAFGLLSTLFRKPQP